MPDRDGYPTDAELDRVRTWTIKSNADCDALLEFVRSIWRNADWGIRRSGHAWYVSTGGWSGNEDVIGELRGNVVFWISYWVLSRRGGHYIFAPSNWELPRCEAREPDTRPT